MVPSGARRSVRVRAVERVFAAKAWYYSRRYPRLELGRGVQIRGRLRLRLGVHVRIGDGCRVNRFVRFTGTGVVTIGAQTLLNGCWIGSWEAVDVGERCLLANCEITDSDFHNVDPASRHEPAAASTRRPVHLGDNVWVGSRALVLKGSTIGDDSVVGAGSVVRGLVPSRVVAVGNPAVVARQL
ncbi:acyltransferase [Jatrophihabitans sp. YIM 134969]